MFGFGSNKKITKLEQDINELKSVIQQLITTQEDVNNDEIDDKQLYLTAVNAISERISKAKDAQEVKELSKALFSVRQSFKMLDNDIAAKYDTFEDDNTKKQRLDNTGIEDIIEQIINMILGNSKQAKEYSKMAKDWIKANPEIASNIFNLIQNFVMSKMQTKTKVKEDKEDKKEDKKEQVEVVQVNKSII